MTSSTIHGHHIEATVEGCNLSPELYSPSHPLYVCFKYGDLTCITVPIQDGGKNTGYPNKAGFPLIEGQNEIKFVVWKNIDTTFDYNDFMGSGRVYLHNVVSKGSEDSSCPFQKENNSHGELKLALQCTHASSKKSDPSSSSAKSAPRSYPQHPYSLHNFSTDPMLSHWPHYPTYPSLPQPYQCSLPYPPPPPTHYLPQYLVPSSHHHLPPYPPPPPTHYLPQYLVPSSHQHLPPYLPIQSPPPLQPLSYLSSIPFVASLTSIASNLFQFVED